MNTFFSKAKKIIIVVLILVFVFVLPLLASLNPFFTVEFGTLGVVTQFGKISRIANPGLNFKIPAIEHVQYYTTQKIIYETAEDPAQSPFYNTKQNLLQNSLLQKENADTADYPVDTTTKDGQQVSIRFTLRYSLNPDKVLWIAQNIGSQEKVAERIVQAESRSIARNVAREFPAQELYTGDVFNYQNSVAARLKTNFETNGVILDEFLVRQIKFSEGYLAAVEQKQIEQEKVKTEEFKAQQEEFIKQQKIIRAEGEAKAQEVLKQSMDPLILQKMAIEKWNGILPTYLGGSGEIPMINIK